MLEKNIFEIVKFEINFDKEEYRKHGYKKIFVPESYLTLNRIFEKKVYLESNCINSPKFIQSEFLVLTHNINIEPFVDNAYFDGNLIYNKYINNQFKVKKFNIHSDNEKTGNFSIYLDWEKQFLLGSLDLTNRLNIKLNYKSDFSGSRRMNRKFYEEEYFISYLGNYSDFILNLNKVDDYTNTVNKSDFKVIDLRKILA
ncbi:hypothetical protein EHQ68_06205 [Leptospira congkakensis]|uniref:hypothetical protein n=1 Tax=Leptospira congkakensis TaxID=2484932 RepID=UPI0010915E6A|nr:hypothetical protein [Leptospira congkakensis]TGL90002.1 hypothetical protein EHQ68_06205 [Leptospira congkakensis]